MIYRFLSTMFKLRRWQKRLVQVLLDSVLVALSFFTAMILRLDSFDFIGNHRVWYALLVLVPVSLLVFARLGFYRILIRFIGLRALPTVFLGIAASASVLQLAIFFAGLPIPRSVPAIYVPIALMLIGGVRFAVRALFLSRESRRKTRVVIYGAGESGRQVLSSLREGPEYAPVAFVDDSPLLQGTVVGAIPVHSPDRLPWIIETYGAQSVLLAMPSASPGQRAAILRRLETLPLQIQTIPGMADLVSGRAKISEIADVSIEDLLGRDPVPPRQDLLDADIRGKTVLVTGAGGSIGSELSRQILHLGPVRLLLMDISEFGLYTIDQELRQTAGRAGLRVEIAPLVGSVRDHGRMEAILRRFAVDTVYHAAAYKHVPLVEQNVVEGIRNNVFGTLAAARAAVAAGVQAFILISTDKAVRPTNVMGAAKRMAELVCQALAGEQKGTRFSMVRFGNVLGSSGSVIPLFRRQIAAGGPVTVTHPEINRYFMTIPEAAQLVIQAGAMARGGDVFVLDMGEPVRIADLAMKMVRLSGLNPVLAGERPNGRPLEAGEIEIVFTDLRPGEKLYEELLVGGGAMPTQHPRILTAMEQALPWATLQGRLAALESACEAGDLAAIKALLLDLPIGYAPADADFCDLTWKAGGTSVVPLPALAFARSGA
ncbi:polysaccharide biosynthesis protein [Shinella pollutisoli]|nr:nucleoside-diphosphate sugar epimerase/dehydratase [Shinella pollutisoli]